jgi:uncharacterized protein involved in propanediol utilization
MMYYIIKDELLRKTKDFTTTTHCGLSLHSGSLTGILFNNFIRFHKQKRVGNASHYPITKF